MKKLKPANSCLYLFIFIFLFPVLLFSQISSNETIVITTYYLSPSYAVKSLEVKERLAIGNESESAITNLAPGQIYVEHSIIFSDSTTPPASPFPGEIIYNSNFNKLQFYNGMEWINASE